MDFCISIYASKSFSVLDELRRTYASCDKYIQKLYKISRPNKYRFHILESRYNENNVTLRTIWTPHLVCPFEIDPIAILCCHMYIHVSRYAPNHRIRHFNLGQWSKRVKNSRAPTLTSCLSTWNTSCLFSLYEISKWQSLCFVLRVGCMCSIH